MSSVPEFPRDFVPEGADLGQWEAVEPLFEKLLGREIVAVDELEEWLLDKSELGAGLSEERSRRYIAMTCHTDDEEAERAYLEFIESVVPRCKPCFHKIHEKYLASAARKELEQRRYGVLDREIEAAVEIFRQENVSLQTEDSKLSQQYQKIGGAMTVQFDGEERTLPQMGKYYADTDRSVRQAAWETVWQRRLEERDSIDEIYDELIRLRQKIARNAGFDDYRGYAFKAMQRFDYDIADCASFQDAVAESVVPAYRKIVQRKHELLRDSLPKMDLLRPWDLEVDPLGRPPLRPFEEAAELAAGVQEIVTRLDPDLGGQLDGMRERGELDLDSRKGKAPGGYLSTLDEVRRPFIFMNAAGIHADVETLLHESGHAFHSLATRDEPLVSYRHAPIEFAEVASMTMELFADDYFDVFYKEEEAARAKRKHLERVIQLFPWVAQIDAFQHWIYAHPDHSREQRVEKWLKLDERFGPGVDWSGYEQIREATWQRQLHLFVQPFYYIEYGIAQLGALQIWTRFKGDPGGTIASYRSALALGGSRPLPDLFEAAGAMFDFSADTIGPLIGAVEKDLDALPP